MVGRGFRLTAARLLCAAAAAALIVEPAHAQASPQPASQPPPVSPPPDAAELDPNAPLAPLPDLGVAWPELNAKDTSPSSSPSATTSNGKRATPVAAGDMRYTVQVEGLAAIGNADELLRDFRAQSALQAERKDPANAAQIGRRATADA